MKELQGHCPLKQPADEVSVRNMKSSISKTIRELDVFRLLQTIFSFGVGTIFQIGNLPEEVGGT